MIDQFITSARELCVRDFLTTGATAQSDGQQALSRALDMLEVANKALEEKACEKGCWGSSVSGENPLVGPANTPFCHKEMRGMECGKDPRIALDKIEQIAGGKK